MTRLSARTATLIVAAPPIVALGFTFYGPLQIAGAALLSAGLWSLAWEFGRRIGPSIRGVAGTLLIVFALATLAPMLLAMQWAIGANYATPALSIPEMARWHGVTNAAIAAPRPNDPRAAERDIAEALALVRRAFAQPR